MVSKTKHGGTKYPIARINIVILWVGVSSIHVLSIQSIIIEDLAVVWRWNGVRVHLRFWERRSEERPGDIHGHENIGEVRKEPEMVV